MYVKQQYDYCEVCIMYMYSMYVKQQYDYCGVLCTCTVCMLNSNMSTVGYYVHVQYVC